MKITMAGNKKILDNKQLLAAMLEAARETIPTVELQWYRGYGVQFHHAERIITPEQKDKLLKDLRQVWADYKKTTHYAPSSKIAAPTGYGIHVQIPSYLVRIPSKRKVFEEEAVKGLPVPTRWSVSFQAVDVARYFVASPEELVVITSPTAPPPHAAHNVITLIDRTCQDFPAARALVSTLTPHDKARFANVVRTTTNGTFAALRQAIETYMELPHVTNPDIPVLPPDFEVPFVDEHGRVWNEDENPYLITATRMAMETMGVPRMPPPQGIDPAAYAKWASRRNARPPRFDTEGRQWLADGSLARRVAQWISEQSGQQPPAAPAPPQAMGSVLAAPSPTCDASPLLADLGFDL